VKAFYKINGVKESELCDVYNGDFKKCKLFICVSISTDVRDREHAIIGIFMKFGPYAYQWFYINYVDCKCRGYHHRCISGYMQQLKFICRNDPGCYNLNCLFIHTDAREMFDSNGLKNRWIQGNNGNLVCVPRNSTASTSTSTPTPTPVPKKSNIMFYIMCALNVLCMLIMLCMHFRTW